MLIGNALKAFAVSRILKSFKHPKFHTQQPRRLKCYAYFHHAGKNHLVYRNIGQELLRVVDEYGDSIAVNSIAEGKQLTFHAAKEQAEILAINLGSLGLKRGDHLAIWNLNTIQWYTTWLAASLGGFPLVCINPALQPAEVAFCLKKAKVAAIITAKELGPLKFELILKSLFKDNGQKNFPDLKFIALQGQDVDCEHFVDYNLLMSQKVDSAEIDQLHCNLDNISPEAACNIQFTSGTTGTPKAAVLTHYNIVNLAHVYGRVMNLSKSVEEKLCLPIPLFHVFGLSMAMTSLHYNNTLVFPNPFFKGDIVLDVIEKEKCRAVAGAPAMYVDMIQNQLKQKRSLDCLDVGFVGGSTCTPDLYIKCKRVLGIEDMRIGYGMSESTSGVVMHDGTEPEEKAAYTVGKICENCQAKIINHEGETLPYGEVGELCLRGFCVFLGYLDDEEETRKTITKDGWLKTGDEAILQPDGVLTFEGRKKNLIIRGGENIFPKEVQNVIVQHESVLEAQAIGVPDERMGEEICVYLRLKPGAKLTEADVQAYCEGKMAKFKIPKYVRFIEEFPRTATGKTQKFKLREMFKNEQNKQNAK